AKSFTVSGDSSNAKILENTTQHNIDGLHKLPQFFVRIQQAEACLESTFHDPDEAHEVPHEPETAHTTRWFLQLRASRRIWRKFSPTRIMRYIGCSLRIVWEGNPPSKLRWRMSFHKTSSGQYDYSHVLKYLYRMRELNTVVQEPDWRDLAIASDV
ncbi:MAG: hypothetical protein Q9198_008151, partial [Flavoplaca austrocitrina]